ncbi:hypothetical protein GW915_00215 [bacterium]|nr:hypothetical protein [bacterium]
MKTTLSFFVLALVCTFNTLQAEEIDISNLLTPPAPIENQKKEGAIEFNATCTLSTGEVYQSDSPAYNACLAKNARERQLEQKSKAKTSVNSPDY